MGEAFLQVEAIEAGYSETQVLFGVSLTVGAGEALTLLGRNGMGKTTTLMAVMGTVARLRGDIRFRGESIWQAKPHAVARRGIALVPEGRRIFPNLSAHENLLAGARNASGAADPWTVDRIYALFPQLAERRRSMGSLLSGGEQQMLAIGRALMTNPDLLMLDEAAEGLSPVMQSRIWEVLRVLKEQGLAILVVDKDIRTLGALADRHFILEKGRTVWQSDSAALLAADGPTSRYLGV